MNSGIVHAHLIMVHNNPAQFERLFATIDHPQNLFVIHVDSKSSPDVHQAAARLANAHHNLHILPARDVRWASWSVMEATLIAIDMLRTLDASWQYFSNLSGQDFPLKSQDNILASLQKTPERNYIHHFDPLVNWVDGPDRIRYVRLELPGMKSGFAVPKLKWNRWKYYLGETKYHGGTSYFTLTRAMCDQLLDSEKLPSYRRFFKHTFSSDEIFIPTFALNSPLKETVHNDDLRLIDFSEGNPRPRTWTTDHLDQLLTCGDFYARKFDPAVDDDVIAQLAQQIT